MGKAGYPGPGRIPRSNAGRVGTSASRSKRTYPETDRTAPTDSCRYSQRTEGAGRAEEGLSKEPGRAIRLSQSTAAFAIVAHCDSNLWEAGLFALSARSGRLLRCFFAPPSP